MEKNRFVELMESLQRKSDLRDSVLKLLRGADVLYEISHDEEIVDLLTEIFDDKDEWISYWVWELDFGRQASVMSAVVDDRAIALFNSEQLYDLLTGKPIYIDELEPTLSDDFAVKNNQNQAISFIEFANRITESMYATSYDRLPKTVK